MDPRRVFGSGAEAGSAAERSEIAARRLKLIAAGLSAPEHPANSPDDADRSAQPWWADHTRVVDVEPPLPQQVMAAPTVPGPARLEPQAEPPPFPEPGRHAARRRSVRRDLGAVRSRLPEIAPGHLAVVALAVAIALAVTTWWVARDQAAPMPASTTVAGEPADPIVDTIEGNDTAAAPSDGASGVPDRVTVDVAGKVRRPGIVVLDQGSRVTDAIDAAGGTKRGVDLTSINQARVLVDGEQIVIGAPSAAAPTPTTNGSDSGAPAPGALVNLNSATTAELEGLPQVGPVTAAAIVAWRDRTGGFTNVDELLEVDGIGEKTLAQLSPYVTV